MWRRPRPTTRPKDTDREEKPVALGELLRRLPADETAVFVDEVDLNPKVGCQRMRRGEQATVETPGTNEKRYLAGSIHWRTGRVFLTEGRPKEGRGAACSCGAGTTCGGRSGAAGWSTSSAAAPPATSRAGATP